MTVGSLVKEKSEGNPEGKGSNALLLDWHRSEPRGVVVKQRRQVLAEFFTSMLVLSASFKYRPVQGNPNYLYWMNGEWSLSLIAPDEWTEERRAGFAGTCILQHDMTWTIAPSAGVSENGAVAAALRRFYEGFARMMDTDVTLEEILPTYVARLPYYQRLFASALSRSLKATLTLGGQTHGSCRQWAIQLPYTGAGLLTRL